MGCHTCDNPPCCNLRHLYVGTGAQNTADAIERGHHPSVGEGAKTHCKHGHEFTPENIYWHQNGSRQCRECRKLRQRKPGIITPSERTHCPRGHPYDEANTHVKAGCRNCRACDRDRHRMVRDRRRLGVH